MLKGEFYFYGNNTTLVYRGQSLWPRICMQTKSRGDLKSSHFPQLYAECQKSTEPTLYKKLFVVSTTARNGKFVLCKCG